MHLCIELMNCCHNWFCTPVNYGRQVEQPHTNRKIDTIDTENRLCQFQQEKLVLLSSSKLDNFYAPIFRKMDLLPKRLWS